MVADAFLRGFSIEFGEVQGTSLMTGRNAVRARPLVSDGNGGYLLTLAGNLRRGIRPQVEATLKADQETFTKYSAVRSAYVEQETAAYFRKALKAFTGDSSPWITAPIPTFFVLWGSLVSPKYFGWRDGRSR